MKSISASEIHHIRLGRKAKWADTCLKNGTIKFGYNYVDHKPCIQENWNSVRKQIIQWRKKNGRSLNKSTITRTVNIIKIFYKSNENVMWITFHDDKMYWCFSKKSIRLDSNNDKERSVIGKWESYDVNKNPLLIDEISTAITKIRRVEGTISTFKEKEKILNLINNKKSHEVLELKKSLDELKPRVGKLVKNLHWKDFELLIDLIFRQGGWQRTKSIGGSEETLDLTLFSPITKEKILVQVKSYSTLKQFREYQKRFTKMTDFDKKFFVVHTSEKKLKDYKPKDGTFLWTLDDIVEQIISLGLIYWIMNKSV